MSAAPKSSFTLLIETGLHAGTVQRLAPGIYTLGSELEADIVLSDEGVKPIHAIIEFGPQGLRLEPLQGSLVIQGEKDELQPGAERHLSFPATVTIGEASLRVTAPTDAVKARGRMRALVMATGLAVLAIVGFQIIDPFAEKPADGQPLLAVAPDGDTTTDTTSTSTAVDASRDQPSDIASIDAAATEPVVSLDEAATALRERLAAEDFADIDVRTGVDRIMADGAAQPERMGQWQDIRFWFDTTYGQDILLVATVEPAEPATPPDLAIEAVWSGEKPYLIAGGRRFFVGNEVGDGWSIEHIGAEEITFRRGDKSFSLTL